MADESKKINKLFRLEVASEDAYRFELLLNHENINFQSYFETVQDLVKVFVFYKSDNSKINEIVKNNQIMTGLPDNPMISPKTRNINKIALLISIIIAIFFIILKLI